MNKLMLALLITFYPVFALAQKIENGVDIMHVYNNGDRKSSVIFASDEGSLNIMAGRISKYKTGPFMRKTLIKKSTLKYLENYLTSHCDSSHANRTGDFFVITIYRNGHEKSCYIKDKTTSIRFFKELTKWMGKYPEKSQAKLITSKIEEFCN